MSKHVRVPDPVYDRLDEEADSKDTSMGEIVRDWMEDSDELERLRGEKR